MFDQSEEETGSYNTEMHEKHITKVSNQREYHHNSSHTEK